MKNLIILYLYEQIEYTTDRYKYHIICNDVIKFIRYDIDNIINNLLSQNLLKKDRDQYCFDVNIVNHEIEIKFKKELNG